MSDCCNYFEMIDRSDSFETWAGLRGKTGPRGPQGFPGKDGANVALRGPVATVDELPDTAPAGDLWLVGEDSPYTGYFWNGERWVDVGDIAAGPGVPAGGLTGQYLAKAGDESYETGWKSPANVEPLMDGDAAAGTSDELSRADHVHPSDTSRQAKITASGILKGDGLGGVSAATAGTDYATPAQVDEKVSKTGDTMTGLLTIENSDPGDTVALKSTTYDKDVTPASGLIHPCSVALRDKDNSAYGFVRAFQSSNGQYGIRIYSMSRNDDLNELQMTFNANGNRVINVVDAASAWRLALGIGDASGDFPITLAQGGSGQTGTITVSANDCVSAAANVSISQGELAIWGKVAALRMVVSVSASLPAGSAILNIKPGYRPKTPVLIGSLGSYDGYISASTYNLICKQSIPSGTSGIVFIGTYIIE